MIPLFRPRLPKDGWMALRTVFETGMWASGLEVAQFEKAFMDYTGYEDIVATSSGTMAAQLLFRSMQIDAHNEIHRMVVPALAFVSPVQMAMDVGIAPKIVDIDPKTWVLDLDAALEVMQPGDVLLGLDYGACEAPDPTGMPNGVWIRDAAHRVARFMAASAWPCALHAFHPTKTVYSLGGGAVALRAPDALGGGIHMMRSFSRSFSDETYDVIQWGTNGYMTNVSAAVARLALKDLPENTRARHAIAWTYCQKLPKELERQSNAERNGHYIFPVLLPVGASRRDFVAFMRSRGIEVGIHYPLLNNLSHLRPFWTRTPVAQDVGSRVVSLPFYPGLTTEELEAVCSATADFLSRVGLRR